jgi:hypothetical protein
MPIPPRRPDPRSLPTRIMDPPVALPPAPPPARNAQDPGEPVNVFSRAVDPRKQYPLHFDLLMRELYERGLVPEEWQVAVADEVRLDEDGMDIEFTLIEPKADLMRRIRVDVQQGKLLRVTHF